MTDRVRFLREKAACADSGSAGRGNTKSARHVPELLKDTINLVSFTFSSSSRTELTSSGTVTCTRSDRPPDSATSSSTETSAKPEAAACLETHSSSALPTVADEPQALAGTSMQAAAAAPLSAWVASARPLAAAWLLCAEGLSSSLPVLMCTDRPFLKAPRPAVRICSPSVPKQLPPIQSSASLGQAPPTSVVTNFCTPASAMTFCAISMLVNCDPPFRSPSHKASMSESLSPRSDNHKASGSSPQ
mmetsp:Transcript_3865/g.14377  ORF Transcript_3865/g.14377 Transcript_3865/m.14377 type:complete len:246 (-) Transcript_3865:519-1256(-)